MSNSSYSDHATTSESGREDAPTKERRIREIARHVRAAEWNWYAGMDPENNPVVCLYLSKDEVRAFAVAMLDDGDAKLSSTATDSQSNDMNHE